MAHAEKTVVIKKSPEAVYDFLADGMNNPKWRDAVISIELASGAAGMQGAVYKQMLKGPGGRAIAGDYRITEANPSKKLSFVVIAGPARPVGHYTLEPTDGGTKATFVLDFQPKGLFKLMNGVVTKTMQSEVANLDVLKQVLEKQ